MLQIIKILKREGKFYRIVSNKCGIDMLRYKTPSSN